MGRKMEGLSVLEKHDIKDYMKKERDPDVKMRLLGLLHVQEGKTGAQTAKIIKVHANTVRTWVKKFIREGLDALKNQPGKGSKKKVDRKHFPAIKKGILELQEKRVGGRIRGEDVRVYLLDKWNVDYCLNSVYNLLKELNLVWISARSKNPVSSQVKQYSFKKNL